MGGIAGSFDHLVCDGGFFGESVSAICDGHVLGSGVDEKSSIEIILEAYSRWGEGCAAHLEGDFACAIWDSLHRKLLLVRDRMGVKPLFYSKLGDSFVFASEIKWVLAFFGEAPKVDAASVAEIMLIGPGRTQGYGVFKGVEELRPGHLAVVTPDGFCVKEYWRLADGEHTDTFEQTVEKVEFLIRDSVEKQLAGAESACTFLSGGLDSSIIAVYAKEYLEEAGRGLDTFSVRYVDNEKYFKSTGFQPDMDDGYIEVMAKFLGTRHYDISIGTDELVDALYDAVEARDLPGMADVDASLLLFCKKVSPHAGVALSGECADEIFGGYPWFYKRRRGSSNGFPWADNTEYRASFLRPEILEKLDPYEYVNEKFSKTVGEVPKLAGTPVSEAGIKEMTKLNMDWFMQTLLERSDRMGRHGGVEIRVPFCDRRIVEYLYTVPWGMKNYRNREKGLLRRAVAELLPEEVLWRKKSPYPKTHNPAYLKELTKILKYIIYDSSAPIHQLVNREALIGLLSTSTDTPWYGQLMTTPQTIAYMIQINYWMQKYRVWLV